MQRAHSAIVRVFFVAATLLVGSMLLIYFVGLAAVGSNQKVATERSVLRHLENAISTLQDAETGQRGYLLTGNETYLGPYHQALEQVHAERETLRRLASAGELPSQSVETVIRLTEEKLAELEQTIQLRRDSGLEPALAVVRVGEGKAIMDKIRAEVESMDAAETLEFEQARKRADNADAVRNVTFFLTVSFNLVFVAWACRRISREIRGREAAVLEIKLQKEWLGTTLSSIGDGVIATDAGGRVTFLNSEAERLTGWKSSEAAGQSLPAVFRIFHETTRQPVENPVEKVIRLGNVVGLANHTILLARDGREIPIDDSAAPIRQPGGPLVGVVLVFRDFTEQRKAQNATAQLAAIVEFSDDAIFTKDLDGVIETWNSGAERLFGYRAEEIIGKPVTVLFPQDRLDEEVHILERLRQGLSAGRLETTRVAKDGRHIQVVVHSSPLKAADGHVTGASKIVHDITDLVASREALAREKELLATTLASIGDGVIVTDAEGQVTFLNVEAEHLTGWKSQEAAGEPLPNVFHIINEHSRQLAENPVDKVLRLGTIVGLANHTLLVRRDGTEVPIDDSAAPIRQSNGPLFGVVLVFRDFTEHKQREQQLSEQARLLDLTTDTIFTRDAHDRITFWNKGAEETYGYKREEALGRVTHELLQTEFPEALESINKKLHRDLRWSGELVHRSRDRRRIVVSSRWALEPATQGQPARVLETNNDITERKRAEEALRDSESQFRQMADVMPQMVWTARPDGYIDYYNERWYEFTGFPRAEFGQSSWQPILHPEDVQRCVETYFSCIREAKPYQIEYRFKDRSTGDYRWFMGRALPVRNERGEIVRWFGTCTDIDEQKRAEEKLEKIVEERTAKLREMVSELQHVSYAMVHDMRAPLRAMQAFAQLLANESSEETPEQRQDHLRRIMTAASRLDKLVQDALGYNKAVLQELPLQHVELTPLLRGLIETYPNLAPANADIRVEGELPIVCGNEALLAQCFSNLLGNAVKFVAGGVRPQVTVRAESRDSWARIWVEDNGIGIPNHAQKRLFGMFQKLDSEYEGTGIGLAIVRKVTERMGGKVGAESEPGRGSRFWVELRRMTG